VKIPRYPVTVKRCFGTKRRKSGDFGGQPLRSEGHFNFSGPRGKGAGRKP
jgi:hypothetical protein